MTPSPPPAKKRRRGCGCLLLLISTIVSLVILEVVLRTFQGHFLGEPREARDKYQLDGERSFQLTPGWRGQQTIDGRTTDITINSLGIRGPELKPKSSGTKRVVVFGDSFVFGHGAAEGETIPARLQHYLRESMGSDVEVINCGISGQGLRDMATNVARRRDLDADLIVACTYIGNDFSDDCRVYTGVYKGFIMLGTRGRLVHTSARYRLRVQFHTVELLERMIASVAPSLAVDERAVKPTPEEIEAYALFPRHDRQTGCVYFDRTADDALVKKILDRCRESYRKIEKIAGDRPVLHVLIPGRWHVHRKQWDGLVKQMDFDPKGHEFGKARKRMFALAKELGLDMCDPTDALAAEPKRHELWFKRDNHFSPKGYDFVARFIAPLVAKRLGK